MKALRLVTICTSVMILSFPQLFAADMFYTVQVHFPDHCIPDLSHNRFEDYRLRFKRYNIIALLRLKDSLIKNANDVKLYNRPEPNTGKIIELFDLSQTGEEAQVPWETLADNFISFRQRGHLFRLFFNDDFSFAVKKYEYGFLDPETTLYIFDLYHPVKLLKELSGISKATALFDPCRSSRRIRYELNQDSSFINSVSLFLASHLQIRSSFLGEGDTAALIDLPYLADDFELYECMTQFLKATQPYVSETFNRMLNENRFDLSFYSELPDTEGFYFLSGNEIYINKTRTPRSVSEESLQKESFLVLKLSTTELEKLLKVLHIDKLRTFFENHEVIHTEEF